MPAEAQPHSPVGLLSSLDTPVRGKVSGAPTSLPSPQQQPWFHPDKRHIACALLLGCIAAVAVYIVAHGVPALKLSRTGVAALAGAGTAATKIHLYRNGADAVIQTARWLIAAAIKHALLVLFHALFVILVATHATLLGGMDKMALSVAEAHTVRGPQCVGLHSARGGSPTFEAPPVYPRLFH